MAQQLLVVIPLGAVVRLSWIAILFVCPLLERILFRS